MTKVMTVSGPVEGSDLGVTLPHEHVIVNLMKEFRLAGLFYDVELAVAELARFRSSGGASLVDCTNVGIGRDPAALQTVAELTGLNIVMGSGFYRDPYLDHEWIDRHSIDQIADTIVHDIEVGVDGTEIKAGIIGEVACDRGYLSACEERAFRAAARAHLRTGVTITTHATFWPVGDAQLQIFREEGVDPHRVIIGHCDSVPAKDYHLRIADQGAFVQFDMLRGLSEFDTERQIAFVAHLRDHGHLEQILLSQDICFRSLLHTYGGCGYDYVLNVFSSRLRSVGFSEDDLRTLTIDNPRRALTGGR